MTLFNKPPPLFFAFIKGFLISVLLILLFPAFGSQPPRSSEIQNNLKEYYDLASWYVEVEDNHPAADSISRTAIEMAEMTFDPQLIVEAYFRFLENTDLRANNKEAIGICEKAERICNSLNDDTKKWRLLRNKTMISLGSFDYDRALEQGYQAFTLAERNGNTALKAKSYLLIAQSLEGKNQKIEGFRNYLNALYLAEKLKQNDLLNDCYWHLSRFFNLSKYLDKAIEYKLKQAELLMQQEAIDSVALMGLQLDLEEISFNSDNNKLNERNINRILEFAYRTGNKKLKNSTLGLYRAHLIEAENLEGLHDLYKIKYPEELVKLRASGNTIYFRLMAYLCEIENKPDSAIYYFAKADSVLQPIQNKIMLSNFNFRYGQFFVRQHQMELAIEKFEKALSLAVAASYFQFILSASVELEILYQKEQDFENAYYYLSLHHNYEDSLAILTQKDEFLKLEIDNETRQQQLYLQQEKLATTRRHNLQYMGITIAIATIFIFLIMLGNFKIQEWVIRMLGFFSFIFLFEFIILLADQKIHHATHGEPWKIMLIKIFLIAVLLPLHHWIEERVIQYLLSNKLINLSGISIKKFFTERFAGHRKRPEKVKEDN